MSSKMPLRVNWVAAFQVKKQNFRLFLLYSEYEITRNQGYSTGAKLTAGASAIGLGALIYNGLNPNANIRSVDKAAFWPAYIKERIGQFSIFKI